MTSRRLLLRPEDAPVLAQSWRAVLQLWLPRIHWLHLFILTFVPLISIVGICTTPLQRPTLVFSIIYYFVSAHSVTFRDEK